MAVHSTISARALDDHWVLAPERYDPRRRLGCGGVPLLSLAQLSAETLQPGEDPRRFLVLDTSHAVEGLVRVRRAAIAGQDIGSAKRVLRAGDVLISRLRPYLRQVAWVDPWLLEQADVVVASTEFYVLRAHDERSIAFLAPYLLSEPVQRALAAAQEGGHHPRVPRAFVERLPVPRTWLAQREACAQQLAQAARAARAATAAIAQLVRGAATAVQGGDDDGS